VLINGALKDFVVVTVTIIIVIVSIQGTSQEMRLYECSSMLMKLSR